MEKDVHLRARGNFTSSSENILVPASVDDRSKENGSFLQGLFSRFDPVNDNAPKSSSPSPSAPGILVQCPADYSVQVTEASLQFFGTSIKVPISGMGKLRVLYADPKLRIFVSPMDTSKVKWEEKGLIVVQIRTSETDLVGADE